MTDGAPRVFMLDNYDSFTYNLVQYLRELGAEVQVARNDEVTPAEITDAAPDGIVISPGPGTPDSAGVSLDLVRHASGRIPLLGVCLGHQSIGQVFGAKVVRAERLMHGKTSPINHDGRDLFQGIESPFEATRYHSLILEPGTVGDPLEVTARTAEGEIMALRHRMHPTWGVQFHPESILTSAGKHLLGNFLGACRRSETAPAAEESGA